MSNVITTIAVPTAASTLRSAGVCDLRAAVTAQLFGHNYNPSVMDTVAKQGAPPRGEPR